jgi:hypothetical protein
MLNILILFIPAKRLNPLVLCGRTALPTGCGAWHPLGGRKCRGSSTSKKSAVGIPSAPHAALLAAAELSLDKRNRLLDGCRYTQV